MENQEIWKDVVGYEGLYQASNLGNIRSLTRFTKDKRYDVKKTLKGKLLKLTKREDGYLIITFRKNKTAKKFRVHRLICETFIENIENKPCVNHINGNKTDNSIKNLEWCTYKENMIHAFETGLSPSGEKHYISKLNNEQVLEIKQILKKDYILKDIAKKYNVTHTCIIQIRKGKSWKSIG